MQTGVLVYIDTYGAYVFYFRFVGSPELLLYPEKSFDVDWRQKIFQ